MTIALKGNAQGGVIIAGGTPAENVTQASGLPFMKNKLINGEVTRINQRGFNGNWVAKNTWTSTNTIAQQELCYGYDMWARASATTMCQLIESGNFRPNTVHTLSGIGVVTQQITSPASGNWKVEVPQGATFVQVEEGLEATPFEVRPIGFELAQCQRYFRFINGTFSGETRNAFSYNVAVTIPTMRATPICASSGDVSPTTGFAATSTNDLNAAGSSSSAILIVRTATATAAGFFTSFYGVSAVI